MLKKKVDSINTIFSGISNKNSDDILKSLLEFSIFLKTDYKVEYEPFIITRELLYSLLNLCSHKSNEISEHAASAGKKLMSTINEHSIRRILPVLLDFSSSLKWKTSINRLILLDELSIAAPLTVSRNLNTIIPVVSDMMWDSKPQIKKRASKTMTSLCNTLDNKDIVPFIPNLVKCIEDPNNVLETVHKLASTTFVQSVTSPALSIMVPLLKRGFVEKKDSTIRLCARIVDNMAKLVCTPLDAAPFLPELLPLLESAKENVSDPEVRAVCDSAYKSLSKSGDLGKLATMKTMSADNMLIDIEITLSKCNTDIKSDKILQIKAEYISLITSSLIDCRITDKNEWALNIKPYLNLKTNDIFEELYNKAMEDITIPKEDGDDENVEVLCDCNFSLAYGNKILLNSTDLKLKRGYKYGLVGKNDCGKTSLLRAIANGQVEDFPIDTVRTLFVETDVQGDLSDLTATDYIYADPLLKDSGYTKQQMEKTLNSVGFKEGAAADTTSKVGQLSGGWRMKLALARAMLLQADILLLDEPTNHLDPYNVSWLQQYLKSITNVTVITISSDKRLLDEICSHIIQIDSLKLNYTKGNLSNFVKKHPEAQSYFDLKACKQKFIFPSPGPIEGVTSKGKIILKMNDITFTYPGVKKAQLHKVSVRVSMSSRVAVVGANGAGKSTMIKLLTGELKPDKHNADGSACGEVWKHPNCKIAYVAQHAFHHIEHHLDKTPNEYIRWRFQYGDDKEALTKVTTEYTEDELARMKEPFIMDEARESDGEKIRVKKIMKKLTSGRRNASMGRGISYEYECEWVSGLTTWLSLQRLIDAGWHKAVKTVDEKVSARETAFQRPLTTTNVEKALGECGLSPEFSTHTRMSALSGGQKVKVVLCSSMWSQPHIVILDEPTNYLDRDSMGALSNAIDDFAGGVVLITHNGDFSGGLCPEMWHLENNTLNLKGDPSWLVAQDADKDIVTEQLKTFEDASGNTVKIKPLKKTLSRAEKKKRDRIRKLRIRNGESISDMESEEEY